MMAEKNKKAVDEKVDENNLDECNVEIDDLNCSETDNDKVEKETEEENIPEENSSPEEETRDELLKKLLGKQKESQEYLDMLRRTMADFDNYRKRTNKEKESVYDDGFAEAVKTFLPVLDNLERAVNAGSTENSTLYEGLKMVVRIFSDTLEKSGVSEIKTEGEKFNPEYHNAVMHIEDETFEENSIVEVLQKGYMYKDKIIRHSMVKVAN
jgi:molecular chaperone GrpE